MFARVVEIKTKPGKAKDLCHTIHNKVFKTLKVEPGFVDEIVLISDTEADRVVAVSFWKTKEDAERFGREQYPKIYETIQHHFHTAPKVHTFSVETSTTHKIARGQAA
jgi:heme-degrading monooxygenase HmoA